MANNLKDQFATREDLKKLGAGIGKDIRGFKDEIRGDIKEYKDELKGYMGLLHERFSDEIKVVAEQYTSIDKRLTKVESKADTLIETVADIKVDTAIIREELESKADKREQKKLEHRVAVLESRA